MSRYTLPMRSCLLPCSDPRRLGALGLALLAGCASLEEPWATPIAFDTGQVVIRQEGEVHELLVEIAETEDQRTLGLRGRSSLDPDSGMLFLLEEVRSGEDGFWMWRTRMPLDIAFLDEEGIIGAILAMEPCESRFPGGCPEYAPGVDYLSALEVNRGWFERRGVEVGARVELRRSEGEGDDPDGGGAEGDGPGPG